MSGILSSEVEPVCNRQAVVFSESTMSFDTILIYEELARKNELLGPTSEFRRPDGKNMSEISDPRHLLSP